MRIVTPEIGSYFASLRERIGEILVVPFESVSTPDWKPLMSKCHENTDYWVAWNPDLKVVRGWMTWGKDESGNCTFIAHSVIDDGGSLFDITPIDINTPRPKFLAHHGEREAFDAMQPEWSMVDDPFILEMAADWAEL